MKRAKLVACRVTTGLVASSLMSAGVTHVLHAPESVEGEQPEPLYKPSVSMP